jgi:hypothetical protein
MHFLKLSKNSDQGAENYIHYITYIQELKFQTMSRLMGLDQQKHKHVPILHIYNDLFRGNK